MRYEEFKNNYELVCKTLDNIFKIVFSKSKSYSFGSTVVGIGLIGQMELVDKKYYHVMDGGVHRLIPNMFYEVNILF